MIEKVSILLFKGLPLFGFLIFQFINAPTSLCLNRDKTKGQSGKNATLTLTKTLSKKQDHSLIHFQIYLFNYKLDFQNKNYIYKIKNTIFFLQNSTTNQKKKKSHHTRVLYKIKKHIFFFYKIVPLTKKEKRKKKPHHTREAHVIRLVYFLCGSAQDMTPIPDPLIFVSHKAGSTNLGPQAKILGKAFFNYLNIN